LASAAFEKIKFSFQPSVLKMLVWGKTHFQSEPCRLGPKLKIALKAQGTKIEFLIFP
jgi:hypothetical protein